VETKNIPDSLDESIQRRTELFNKYVLPHKNLVYKLCIKYSFSSSDIEDNYNEVLINFFKYIETYDPARSIQTWLHIVTKRFISDMNTRNSAFKRTEDVDISEISNSFLDEDDAGSNSMSINNYHSLYNDDILEALKDLKPIYREALLLQQAGYKLNEIMEISYRNGNLKTRNLETVKSRLFLAKLQMRKLITRDGEKREE
jgi:RNA polymerase sigma factor (sigma-70 family)